MEKGRVPDDINMRAALQEAAQALHRICLCLRLPDIEGDLFLYILPSVRHCIVHMYRIPHDVSQKAHSIIMVQPGGADHHVTGFLIIIPDTIRDDFPCRAVNHFPPAADVITCVYRKHVRIEMAHQVDTQCLFRSIMEICHNIHLLHFVHVCLCPFVVFSRCIICRIYLCIHIA